MNRRRPVLAMRRLRAKPASIALALALGLGARTADADLSSWVAVGGGYAGQRNPAAGVRDYAPAFTYSIGVGTSPLSPLVVGVLYRGTTMFGLGTDVGAAVRLCTGGFARGNWGVALDAGALWRSWGEGSHGDWPVQA